MAPRARVQRLKVEGNGLSSREAEKIRVATLVLERESWTVDDFAKNLGVRDYGLDTSKDLGADVGIDNDAIIAYFGPRGDQGWRLDSNYLSQEDICDCRRQSQLVYGHLPSNGFYLATFLRAWLAEKNNHKVNWAKFAYDATKRQVTLRKNVENKKMKVESGDATPSSSKQSSFSDWIDNKVFILNIPTSLLLQVSG
jgi:hypothetical protein